MSTRGYLEAVDVLLYRANADFADVMKIKDLEMGRFSSIIQVVQSNRMSP